MDYTKFLISTISLTYALGFSAGNEIEQSEKSGTLYRCVDSATTCCRFVEQHDSQCTFDRDSCGIWQAPPGNRIFTFQDDGLGDPVSSTYAYTNCLAGATPSIVQPAILQSEPRYWTRNGRDVRLNFQYFIPPGVSRLSNLTVHAVFSINRNPVLLTTVVATTHEAWVNHQFYLRDLGMAYGIRFTAHTLCDEVIGLNSIILDTLTPTSETECLPTTAPITTPPTTTTITTTTTVKPTTRRPVPSHSVDHVVVRLIDYRYTPNPDTCDANGGQCDPELRLRYHWKMKDYSITTLQTVAEQADSNHITFQQVPPTILAGTIRKGSRVEVEVEVKDIDGSGSQGIGQFEFEYVVPQRYVGPRNVTLRDRQRRWYSDLTLEFEAVF